MGFGGIAERLRAVLVCFGARTTVCWGVRAAACEGVGTRASLGRLCVTTSSLGSATCLGWVCVPGASRSSDAIGGREDCHWSDAGGDVEMRGSIRGGLDSPPAGQYWTGEKPCDKGDRGGEGILLVRRSTSSGSSGISSVARGFIGAAVVTAEVVLVTMRRNVGRAEYFSRSCAYDVREASIRDRQSLQQTCFNTLAFQHTLITRIWWVGTALGWQPAVPTSSTTISHRSHAWQKLRPFAFQSQYATIRAMRLLPLPSLVFLQGSRGALVNPLCNR